MRNLTFLHFEWNFIYFFLQKTILFLFGVLCGSIDWASKIFYCFFCHFWAQNQFECVPDVVCKVLLCVQFSLKFWVVYLFSNLLQLTVESRTWFISSSEKKILLLQAEQIHQMTMLFNQNYHFFITMRKNLLNWCNLVSISKNVVFYAFEVVRIY